MMNKVLAIDDDDGNLKLVIATLDKFIPDCKVLIAHSGYEGIAIARRELPDTILLDIMMPEVDGFEVCRILKKESLTSNIPIIFFSGYVTDSHGKIKGLDLGADAFLEKPIDPAELAAQVRVMLRIKQAEDNLKNEVEKYKVMTETLPDAVLTVDQNGEINFISPIALELFKLNAQSEYRKKNVFELLFSEKPEIARQMLNEVLLLGRVKDVEMTLSKADDSSFIAEVSTSLIENKKAGNFEFILVIKDITNRKKAETEILNYQKSLKSQYVSLRMTEERERKRIAGNLHDGIGQMLSLARINLTSLSKYQFLPEIETVIQESAELINKSILETRSLTLDLSPPILFELGLIPALEWRLKLIGEKFGIKTSLSTNKKEIKINNDLRILIYRIISELLNNTIKHANADFINMNLDFNEQELAILFQDNGKGFNYNSVSVLTEHGGFGLFNIKEQLDSVQGSLDIFSDKLSGTKIKIDIPL